MKKCSHHSLLTCYVTATLEEQAVKKKILGCEKRHRFSLPSTHYLFLLLWLQRKDISKLSSNPPSDKHFMQATLACEKSRNWNPKIPSDYFCRRHNFYIFLPTEKKRFLSRQC